MNIGIVGATGMVGQNFLKLLDERNFPVRLLKLFASQKSVGNKILFRSQKWTITSLKPDCFHNLDIVFFSSGEEISLQWVPQAAKAGAIVIDNSAAFRMHKNIPLVVPEVNKDQIQNIKSKGNIIANPNCSTIQLVVALKALHDKFELQSVHISSYQSISGAGLSALSLLKKESLAILKNPSLLALDSNQTSLAFNCIPQIGSLNPDGFSTEETKLMTETKKILNLPNLNVTATAVRVPTFNGHGEAVIMNFQKATQKTNIITTLQNQSGLQVLEKNHLPHQRFVDNKNDIFIGRIRSSDQKKTSKSWMIWIATDNIRKGAALNSLQIAESLIK